MMRIITGTARGTHLDTLEGENTRPTSERFKEALFSMLQFDLEGRRVLDLFGGSGQLGLEALSRGAESAVFIDNVRDAADVIICNARKCKLFDKCRISSMDSLAYLRGAAGRESFDIIFLDPPYSADILPKCLALIADGELLAPGGTIACESEVIGRGAPKKRKKPDPQKEAENMEAALFGGDAELRSRFEVKRNAVYGISRLTLLGIAEKE